MFNQILQSLTDLTKISGSHPLPCRSTSLPEETTSNLHVGVCKSFFPLIYKDRFFRPSVPNENLSAISSFGLQVIECDQLSEQAALLVASLHSPQLEVGLGLEEDEPQVDGEACHVDGKGPVRVEYSLPAVHLPAALTLGDS